MTNNDTPAFPTKLHDTFEYVGLTKREYLAGQIAAGLVSNPEFLSDLKKCHRMAVELADSLLYELEHSAPKEDTDY